MPWGAVSLLLSVFVLLVDYSWRVEERRIQSWQLLETSNKKEAVEYLNKPDGLFCGDNSCLIILRSTVR